MKALFVCLAVTMLVLGLTTQQSHAKSHECGFLFQVSVPVVETSGSIGIRAECHQVTESLAFGGLSVDSVAGTVQAKISATTWFEFPYLWVKTLRPKAIVGYESILTWNRGFHWRMDAIKFGVCDELYMLNIVRAGICFGWHRAWDFASENLFAAVSFAINL